VSTIHAAPAEMDPLAAAAIERLGNALLSGLHEEQARRAGKKFSVRTGVPGVLALGDIEPIAGLASLASHAPAFELVDSACSRCGEPLQCWRAIAGSVACDPCRAAVLADEQSDKHEKYWSQEHLCPPGSTFRDTDPQHAGFPKSQYEATKNYAGEESFFFFGPTGSGKSRLAVHLLKRCLFKFNRFVGILWPEDLKQAKNSFDRRDEIQRWGRFDVLLCDDSLLTGAQDEKMADFLKDLVDYRMRHGRHMIMTSQVGGQDYEEQLSKYAKARSIEVTAADKRRVDALLRRLRECCRVVAFTEATPKDGEEAF
jgi:DNA replication protein DnaC